jgi:predicted permease
VTLTVLYKLLAIMLVVALGYAAGRLRWLARAGEGDPARLLGNLAFMVFVPALLFRTAARIDFHTLPWRTLAAFFLPVVGMLLLVYASQRRRGGSAVPSVRAISATFGNSVQIGIPMAAALFGESGLAIHVTIVSLHALVLLSVVTTLVELDLARAAGTSTLRQTLATTVRNTVIHPVVLPMLAGLLFNALGLGLPVVLDETLQLLGGGVVPVCLVLIGLSLAQYGVGEQLGASLGVIVVKLLLLPALVLLVAHWGFGLGGLPLAVVVMIAAVPVGSNALIFAQRYETLVAETTGAIVLSTLAFALTAPLWLAFLARV